MATTTVTLSAAPIQHPLGCNHLQEIAADTNNITPNIGFSVDVAGTLSLRARTNTALLNYPVVAGMIYPIDIVQFDKTGSTGPTKIYIHRQAA